MTIQNEKGAIEITNEVFTAISGSAATNCFGVKGMAQRNVKDGIVSLLKRENFAKGVKVVFDGNDVIVDLHIVVEHGVNITAVSNSIMAEVKYIVEQMTCVAVSRVNVYVDSIMIG